MLEDTTSSLVTFAAYLVVMLAVGLWVYRRTTTLSDFVLGGRGLNSWVAALSANASDFSGWLLLGLPGAVYVSGLGSMWIPVGLACGFYMSWRVMAARLRDYTEHVTDAATGRSADALTLSAYFEHRFADHRRLLRSISAVVIIVFYAVYVASGLVAAGLLFDQVFGLSLPVAAGIGVVTIVAYTFLGGFLAVSYTDVIQAILMWGALLVTPVAAVILLGGFGDFTAGVQARDPGLLSPLAEVSLEGGTWSGGQALAAIAIVSGLAWGFGYLGQPHILARFMAIRSQKEVPLARRVSVTWAVTAMSFAVAVGLAGIAYFDSPLKDPESVFIALVPAVLPAWIAGILLAAVLAAIMSTADSQLLVASASLTEDVYRTFVRRDASPQVLVWVGRATVIGVAVVAYALALGGGSVLDLVAYAWAGFGAAFGPVIVASLYWRRMNWVGALSGMVGGAATVLIYRQLDPIGLYEMVPAVAVAVLAIIVGNRFGPQPTAGMGNDFDRVAARAQGTD